VAEVTAEVGVWVSLDLDAWSSYNKFTLRASWPAHVSVWDLFFFSSCGVRLSEKLNE